MRRKTPVLLIAFLSAAFSASASIPTARTAPEPTPELKTDAALLWESGHRLFGEPLDTHPFATEFYIHEFASEAPAENRQHSWWMAPAVTVSNAASGLSKKVASLRRALVRMMP